MRTNKNNFRFKRPLQVMAASLLLLVFLLTPFVEAFHHHGQSANTELAQHSKTADRTQLKAYNFCQICDYLHHAGHHQLNQQQAHFAMYLPVIMLKSKVTAPRIIPALVLSYSNKGPPVV